MASELWRIEKARRLAAGRDLEQRRRRHAALVHHERKARMEMRPGGRRERRRDLALDRREGALPGLDLARFGEQRLRVRMIRTREQLERGRAFNDATEVHDDHAIREKAHDAEIV